MGKTRRGKATKIMAVADGSGLPIAAGIASAQRHEVKLVEQTVDAAFIEALPPRFIGDKADDSDGLDTQLLVERNIEMIAPHQAQRRNKTVDPFDATNDDGRSNGSSHGSSTSDDL